MLFMVALMFFENWNYPLLLQYIRKKKNPEKILYDHILPRGKKKKKQNSGPVVTEIIEPN